MAKPANNILHTHPVVGDKWLKLAFFVVRLQFDFFSIVLSNFLFKISQKTLSDLCHPTPAQETWKFSLLGRSRMIEYYRPSLLYQNLLLMSEFDQEGLSIQSFLMTIPVSFFDAPSSVSFSFIFVFSNKHYNVTVKHSMHFLTEQCYTMSAPSWYHHTNHKLCLSAILLCTVCCLWLICH